MKTKQYRTIPPEEWDKNTVQVGDLINNEEVSRVSDLHAYVRPASGLSTLWLTVSLISHARVHGWTWQRPVGAESQFSKDQDNPAYHRGKADGVNEAREAVERILDGED